MKHFKFQVCTLLAITLATMASSALRAQSAAETLQQKVGLPAQANPPVPTTTSPEDLGQISAVQKFPKPDMFTVSTTQQYFHTDNVFYTQANNQSSSAYLGTYTASFVPYSLVDWTPRLTAQYNMARYGSVPSGDFNNKNIAFSSQYIFSTDRSWAWTAMVDLSNYTAAHAPGGVFYKEVIYDNQISKVMPIGKNNDLFFVGVYDLNFHQSSPSFYNRLDNAFSLSLAYYPRKDVSISPYVRPEARIYTNDTSFQNDRHDFNLSEGVDVTYTPCKYVSVSADITNANDYSNTQNMSYNVFSPGCSVTASYKF
jgi:hypothetical protein